MPRKQRIRPVKNEIQIERNVIEQFLMGVKEYVKNHRSVVLYSCIALLSVIIIVIVTLVIVDTLNNRNQKRFDVIMNEYTKYSSTNDGEKMKEVIKDLKGFIDSTYFGFSHRIAYYVLGNIYYSQKDYKNAYIYLVKYTDKDSSSILAPLALLKAAIALEESGELKGAKEIFKRLEDDYSNSLIADQIFYHYAGLFVMMKDPFNSKKYYNKVIVAFPESTYAAMARKRLFVLGPN